MQERRPGFMKLRLIGGEIVALPTCIAGIMRSGSLSIVIPEDKSLRPQALDLLTGELRVIYPT